MRCARPTGCSPTCQKTQKPGQSDLDALVKDYAEWTAGAPPAKSSPGPGPDTSPPDTPRASSTGGNMFLEAQIEQLRSIYIDPELRESAKSVSDLSRAMGELVASNERQLSLMTAAGRMVDVDEVEVLIRQWIEDHIAELRSLPTSLDADVAKQSGVGLDKVRLILRAVSDRLLASARDALGKVQRESKAFQATHAQRGRAKPLPKAHKLAK